MVAHEGIEPSLFRTENPVTQPLSRMRHIMLFKEYIRQGSNLYDMATVVHPCRPAPRYQQPSSH